jgi:hypothetical protein
MRKWLPLTCKRSRASTVSRAHTSGKSASAFSRSWPHGVQHSTRWTTQITRDICTWFRAPCAETGNFRGIRWRKGPAPTRKTYRFGHALDVAHVVAGVGSGARHVQHKRNGTKVVACRKCPNPNRAGVRFLRYSAGNVERRGGDRGSKGTGAWGELFVFLGACCSVRVKGDGRPCAAIGRHGMPCAVLTPHPCCT